MTCVREFTKALFVVPFLFPCLASAQVSVPATSVFSLNGGVIDLAGANLQVSGAFGIGGGAVHNAANVVIAAGGNLDGGSGTLTLFGDWSDLGTFTAGSSQVDFVDGGQVQSSLSGNTTFANLSFVSTIGKAYSLQVGTTQTIQNQLQILGTSSNGIQIKSSSTGQVAFINLLASGSQSIDFVGVSNVHAIGQHLAPTLTNDGGSGDAIGWFGQAGGGGPGTVAPTPMLSFWALLLLALGLSGVALASTRRLF